MGSNYWQRKVQNMCKTATYLRVWGENIELSFMTLNCFIRIYQRSLHQQPFLPVVSSPIPSTCKKNSPHTISHAHIHNYMMGEKRWAKKLTIFDWTSTKQSSPTTYHSFANTPKLEVHCYGCQQVWKRVSCVFNRGITRYNSRTIYWTHLTQLVACLAWWFTSCAGLIWSFFFTNDCEITHSLKRKKKNPNR